jgi:uncharacterized protein YjbI with pentapeptide repeats
MNLQATTGNFKETVELVRNIIEIIGLPVIAAIALKLHGLQTAALKAENSLLKLTQYDQAEKILVSQKRVFETERDELQTRIQELESSNIRSEVEISRLRERYESIGKEIEELNAQKLSADGQDFRHSVFSDNLSFNASAFAAEVDFAKSSFQGRVQFDKASFAKSVTYRGAAFASDVDFSGATFSGKVSMKDVDLRTTTFHGADLRGVDLSGAKLDSTTKLPSTNRPFESPKL